MVTATRTTDTGMPPASEQPRPGPPQPVPRRKPIRSAARRAGHRSRRQLVPWLLAPVLPLAAEIARETMPHGARVWTGLLLAALAAGHAFLKSERKRRESAGGEGLRRLLAWRRPALLAVAALWAAWVMVSGWNRPALAVFAVMWALPALAWWNRHRSRHQHPARETPDPEPGEPLPRGEVLERLRTGVCGQGQKLPGATVDELPPVKGAQVFEFALVPGRQSVNDVLAQGTRQAIASAAQVPESRVVAEHAPGEMEGEHGPAHLARVTILERQHLHRSIQEFDGPTLNTDTGLFTVGPYQDGQSALSRLYKVDEKGVPHRACSGITSGAQGSGKSRFAEHQVLEQLGAGLFKVFMLDGQGGASIPDLIDYVAWPALWQEEWEECLRAAVRLMVTRTRRQAARRLPCWYADEKNPFVHIQIEEAHKVLRIPVCLQAVKSIVQEGEKVGMGVVPSTQFPSQVELGASSGSAGANVLRDLVSSGNITLFRTGGQFAKNVLVGDIDIAPHRLPPLPGMCHPLGASMRTAPVRAIRAAEPSSWAHSFPQVQFSGLDLEALNGTDDVYAQRGHRLAQRGAEPEAGSLDHGSIDAEVALMLGETVPGQPAAQPAGKATAMSALVGVLRQHGAMKRAQVIEAVRESGFEYSDSALDDAYALLKRNHGVRDDAGRGVWELTGAAARAA